MRVTKDGHKADNYMQQAIIEHLGITPKNLSCKQLLKTTDSMNGGAIRLGKAGKTLCIGEGLETMLAVATQLNTLSVAACCTAQLLECAEIPSQVEKLLIFADKDINGRGLDAAEKLKTRMNERMSVEILLPSPPIAEGAKSMDWLEVIHRLKTDCLQYF